jgi:L-lactate dehydrogenase (cytochrome)
MGVEVQVSRIYSIEDARRRAARALPRPLFDYIDGGADDEVTMGENVRAFREVTFRPRMAVGAAEPTTATTLLGIPLSIPVILAPAGLVRFMHPDGAVGVARAAADKGIVSVLSTVAGTSLEEVAAGSGGPMWFQLYSPGGPAQTEELVRRAHGAGYRGLVVTVDTAALGHRERDVRHGVAQPFDLTPARAARLAAQVAVRPRWLAAMARSGLRPGAVAAGPERSGRPVDPSARVMAMGASPFSWDDVGAIRRAWSGPLLVKGVLTAEDAARALATGADGVVVSNHGGRQLDGAPATMRALPAIVDAVAGKGAVVLDSGVRRGSDVVKALAAGADAVMIGRAYLYGLAAGGQAGVARVLDVLEAEMVRTLVLMGCPSPGDLDRSWIDLPGAAVAPVRRTTTRPRRPATGTPKTPS